MKETKTNYRNVYKSDHLGVVDLEEILEKGGKLIFTIKEVKQEIGVIVAGKKGNFNVAYFEENIKPWVLNSTNAKTIKKFSGGSIYVEQWKNIPVELYIDPTISIKGEVTGGIRIKPNIPTKQKPIFTVERFEGAKSKGATIEKIKEIYEVSPELEKKYIEFYGAEK